MANSQPVLQVHLRELEEVLRSRGLDVLGVERPVALLPGVGPVGIAPDPDPLAQLLGIMESTFRPPPPNPPPPPHPSLS